MLSLALSIGLGLIIALILLAFIVVASVWVTGLIIDRNIGNQKSATDGPTPLPKTLKENDDAIVSFLDSLLNDMQNAPTGAAADRAPEQGHYIKSCGCVDCKNSEEKGGINVEPFLQVMNGETRLSHDGDAFITATSPIFTCSCKFCREAREDGKPNITVEAAVEAMRELNKKYGYAL